MAKAFGASVITVYQTLRDLANKDNHGFLSDVEFNRFANYAQLNVFNNLFNELKDSRRLNKAGFEPSRDKARFKREKLWKSCGFDTIDICDRYLLHN